MELKIGTELISNVNGGKIRHTIKEIAETTGADGTKHILYRPDPSNLFYTEDEIKEKFYFVEKMAI